MTPVETFALGQTTGTAEGAPLSDLLAGGTPTGVRVPGLVLEAQYRFGEEFLLLTTEDVPYEEALHAVLLGRCHAIVDRLQLGHPFAAGILTDLQPAAGGSLRFSFFGGDLWELTIAPARRRFRPSEAPRGVKGRLLRLLVPRRLVLVRLR